MQVQQVSAGMLDEQGEALLTEVQDLPQLVHCSNLSQLLSQLRSQLSMLYPASQLASQLLSHDSWRLHESRRPASP